MTPSVTRLRLAIQCHWIGNQRDLAERCGIDNGTLTRYVRGQTAMSHPHKAILAHVLKVEPEEIAGWMNGCDLWKKLSA